MHPVYVVFNIRLVFNTMCSIINVGVKEFYPASRDDIRRLPRSLKGGAKAAAAATMESTNTKVS